MNPDQQDTLSSASPDETTELIEHFKKQVDREALRENLKLTPTQRLEKMVRQLRDKCPERFHQPHDTLQPIKEEAAAYTPPLHEEVPDETNDLVEAFKKDIDRTLLIENLKLTPARRLQNFVSFMELVHELRRAGRRARENEHRATHGN